MLSSAAIDRLTRSLSASAEILTPGSPGYDTRRLGLNRRFDKRPAVLVAPATEADVAATVRFARDEAVQLSTRAGGTSPAGLSSNDGGVLLDLSKFQSIAVDRAAMKVRVGAGVTLGTLYAALRGTDLMVPAGECRPVGIAGLSLGGGIGLLSRSLGLTCDSLLSAATITADGATVQAEDDGEHADLLWALRGAGGGNFGVVTSLDFRLYPLAPQLATAVAVWPLDQAAEVLTEGLAYFAAEAPDELNAVWSFAPTPTDDRMLVMVGVYNGPPNVGNVALARLTKMGNPALVKPANQAFVDLIDDDFPVPVENIHDYFKSGFVTGPLPRAAAELLVERYRTTPERSPAIENLIFFELTGGAINRVAPTATAFVHRRATVLLSLLATWQGATGEDEPAELRWADDLYRDLAPYYNGGVYQNYPDLTLTDWARAYYGENLARLIDVKRRYDPDDVFRFAQSIPCA